MSRDRIQELRDSLFYAVQELMRETVPADEDTEDNEETYARTDEIMEKVDLLVKGAVHQANELTWEHDGVAFHLTES